MKDIKNFLGTLQALSSLKSEIKGLSGEAALDILARTCLNDSYHIFNNVVLKVKGSETTQIDQILVSEFGIFVVEVKNFKGWIFGSQKDKTWTQITNGKKSIFQNPLHQNYKHLKTLQGLLGLPISKFISLVVFLSADLKTELPPNVVVGGQAYLDFIDKYQPVTLSKTEVHESAVKISENRLTNADHQANVAIKREQYRKAVLGEQPNCPKCGSPMILRTAKKGPRAGQEFWGCSKYPNCTAIINIDREKTQVINLMQEVFNSLSNLHR